MQYFLVIQDCNRIFLQGVQGSADGCIAGGDGACMNQMMVQIGEGCHRRGGEVGSLGRSRGGREAAET